MSQLTAEQCATLVELLEARERSLAAVIDEHVAGLRASSAPGTTTLAGDIADLAEVELVRSHQNATVERDLQALRDIEAARARIAAGSVGNCIDCGGEIGFERLRVQPTASRCVLCQDLYEQTYEQTHLPAPAVAT